MTAKVTYTGELRTKSVHVHSGSEVITDAPTDQTGRREALSPTDMVANSLDTCMFTIMGIKANQMGVNFDGSTASVTKIMRSEPRMISKIIVESDMNLSADGKTKPLLERAALTCPVYLSLHP